MTVSCRALRATVSLLGLIALPACAAGDPATTDSEATASQHTLQQPLKPSELPRVKLKRVAPEHLQAVQAGLEQRLNRSAQGLKVRTRADGTKRVSLEGRFQSVLIANEDESGKAHILCTNSAEGVAAALGH